jgi:hypothetical protein
MTGITDTWPRTNVHPVHPVRGCKPRLALTLKHSIPQIQHTGQHTLSRRHTPQTPTNRCVLAGPQPTNSCPECGPAIRAHRPGWGAQASAPGVQGRSRCCKTQPGGEAWGQGQDKEQQHGVEHVLRRLPPHKNLRETGSPLQSGNPMHLHQASTHYGQDRCCPCPPA